mmetsp:Transcript_26302/g.77765  ORF Transcript_26302/g.77765 Transcript_26302/m.77765 type:complete len:115 (-) Transcript_26302:294-638(-)
MHHHGPPRRRRPQSNQPCQPPPTLIPLLSPIGESRWAPFVENKELSSYSCHPPHHANDGDMDVDSDGDDYDESPWPRLRDGAGWTRVVPRSPPLAVRRTNRPSANGRTPATRAD